MLLKKTFVYTNMYIEPFQPLIVGEHQMELLDCVAAKFHEEPGVFKLLVSHSLMEASTVL